MEHCMQEWVERLGWEVKLWDLRGRPAPLPENEDDGQDVALENLLIREHTCGPLVSSGLRKRRWKKITLLKKGMSSQKSSSAVTVEGFQERWAKERKNGVEVERCDKVFRENRSAHQRKNMAAELQKN